MQAPEWVRAALDNWGRWKTEGGQGGLGYPRSNILARNRGSSASVDHVPIDSVAARGVDQVVQGLRAQQVSLWMAVHCRYVGNPQAPAGRRRPMLYGEMADLLCVSEATARARTLQAELAVMAALQASAVGASTA